MQAPAPARSRDSAHSPVPARSLGSARPVEPPTLAPASPVPASPLPASPGPATAWDRLRAMCQGDLLPPRSTAPGLCQVCKAPVGTGYARCFQCELHAQSAPGLLADTVAPVAYAAKGGRLAGDLWLYKSGRPAAAAAGTRLLRLLLVFLQDHGSQVGQQAGMTRPSHVCVVPSGRGRPGQHPLQALAAPFLALPWVGLRPLPGADPWARSLDPGRFRAGHRLTGAGVLLLDDTWASGASAQSAAAALKQAGAGAVAVVVIGRHVAAGYGACRPAAGQ